MEMAVRHEIFVPHTASLNFGTAPEQTPFRARRHGLAPPDPIDNSLGIHLLPGFLVVKYCLQLAELFFRSAQAWRLQASGSPVDGGEGWLHATRVPKISSEINQKRHHFVRFIV